ncbi:arginine--tRNA ligase, chloroplastic/mitochondrial [Tanacetum coccineum]|uniref:arginine--tRNA ligase n=1 Tax=Tanacetum coccineum TaxID=301880 RepID=A0ABQ5GGM4_9ASTR
MSTSTMSNRSPNHESDGSMPHLDIQNLFAEVVAKCYPRIEANSIYLPLELKYRETYGDFGFYGVLDICEKLREDVPYLFYHTSPIDIAQKIKIAFEHRRFDMIKTLSLHDAGILTFSLEGSWIAERINKMLKNGINTWAPTIYDVESRGRVVFVFPTNPFMGSDMVRAIYMRDALENLYLYSGAEVGRGDCDDEAMRRTHDCFTAIRGKIVSNLHPTSLNGSNVEDVFTDLAILWYGVKIQNADLMVYMTPHRLRGYIEHLHIAAANEGWLPCDWRELGSQFYYCFVVLGPKQALAGKERDLGLHFVKFTEVIERACRVFVPHVLCEYLCDLSELFTCCYREVWPGENMLGLCKATEVVMNKCFQLLGINPSLGPRAVEFWALLSRSLRQLTHYHIPSDDARIEHPNSRFRDLFSLNVAVANSRFVKGNVCGSVRVIDTCRLADGRGWVRLDWNDDCYVSYFRRQWYDAVTIYNGSYIPLGNTSSVHSIPVSSSVNLNCEFKATSGERDQTYLTLYGSLSGEP